MKLRDCRDVASAGLPRIDRSDLEPLWIADYYDGPLAGAIMRAGDFSWFVLAEEERPPYAEGWHRRYWLVSLSPSQQEQERSWHELFRTHVGTHWDFPTGTESRRVKAAENHRLFYEPYSKREPLALDDNEVVGWFQF